MPELFDMETRAVDFFVGDNVTVSKTKCYLQLERYEPISKFLEATIRGAMGYALKRNLCVFKGRECVGCLLRENCNYSKFFEPVPPQGSALQHSMQQAARSWMFNATQFNDKIQLEITLVGNAQNFLESIITTLDEVGREGLGKNRVRSRVCAVLPTEGYNLRDLAPRQSSKASLHFITPITLRSQGSFMRDWDNHLFFATLLRRITNLSVIHNFSIPDSVVKTVLEQAGKLQTKSFLVPIMQERSSTHQNRTINYSGLVGDVMFDGVTPELSLILQAGEILSVGKNTVFGYGKFRITW